MRILIVGSGGREHALSWAMRGAHTLFIAPGNAGTSGLGQNIPIGASQIEELAEFAHQEQIDLAVIGPEVPLALGLADALAEGSRAVFGPSAKAAEIESSKAFAKAFMQRHQVPTADWRAFSATEVEAAREHVRAMDGRCVVKASGLAAGKGAIVCTDEAAAEQAVVEMMVEGSFGEAGDEVVLEELMEGEEVSLFALTDGDDYVLLAPAQDHKRIHEGDLGPNTGGMGAYAPAPVADEALIDTARRSIIEPVLIGMASEGRPYKGCLYAGLMVTADGPRVVEFNCRFGDPEAQVVLPLLDVDPVELLHRAATGGLGNMRVAEPSGAAACVVLASGGYPGSYQKGFGINGLAAAQEVPGAVVFHAGTRMEGDDIVTAGGRVLGVTAVGANLDIALDRAYEAVEVIHFEGMQFRRDIGYRVR